MTDRKPSVRQEIVEHAGGGRVAWLTVHNEAKLNVLGSVLCAELGERLAALAEDRSLRACVLTGAGERAFIGGADIAEMAALEPDTARRFITALHQVCQGLRQLPVPVIARIRGYCLGGGLEVAAACDLRLAAADARFGMPEVRVGIPSVIEAALLPRLVGWGKARELVLTAEMIGAAEALACGLVERVVPVAELDAAVEGWLAALLAAGPRALRAQKALLREWERLPLDQAVARGIDVFVEAYRGDEPKALMTRFLERRR
jgi:enoyl-CoA hydratase/carnithine racemase